MLLLVCACVCVRAHTRVFVKEKVVAGFSGAVDYVIKGSA